ncbi:MAG: CRISPR-associated helicase Cas3' [Chloroflexota bacterium]|nr:CRISPR-associated helicase Cas3' [Chloroflexota bacterium]
MPIYPYQETVFNHLMSGKNVIVQAPTGAGKTQAALYPFLAAADSAPDNQWHGRLPTRCIYSVPMRILAKQFVHAYRNIVKEYNLQYRLELTSAIQTGEQPDDPELTSNLIFATIDQTLSSYLLSPYSLGRSRANLNAGAVMSSYLVFDEFHLFDPLSTLPTTLQMLKTLNGVTPFVLMTATFSETLLDQLGALLNAAIVPEGEEERDALDALESQQKMRIYRVADRPLSAEAVWEAHDRRSLVICNTVDRARRLHQRLRAIVSPETEVILLHSQFLAEDRNRIEDRIRELFGKGADRTTGSTIVVATQAIEVGVDMSCQVLHTELAPANSIIQRAGRCARYPGETGLVRIYGQTKLDLQDDESLVDLTDGKHYLPYEGQKDLFLPTLQAFRDKEGQLKFKDEQEILSHVHDAHDSTLIATIRDMSNNHQQRVFAVQSGNASDDARNLIRDVRQEKLIIHADPDGFLRTLQGSPLVLPAFGLHPGSLMGYVKRWRDAAEQKGLEWAVKFLHELAVENSGRGDEERRTLTADERYEWQDIKADKDALFAPLLVVNPQLATYDRERGLVPDEGGNWQTEEEQTERENKRDRNFTYRLETYAEHIRHVYTAFKDNWHEMTWAAARLEARYGWQPGSIRQAAELAVLLHDVGKLSTDWQGWVRRYQEQIAEADHDPTLVVQPGEAYAHTHLQAAHHRAIEKAMKGRPWHAVEGALSVLSILNTMIEKEELVYAAFGAIARHHAPFSDNHQPFKLLRNAEQLIAATFKGMAAQPDLKVLLTQAEREEAKDFIPQPDNTDDRGAGFLAYLLLVRALRRADVMGTQAGRNAR